MEKETERLQESECQGVSCKIVFHSLLHGCVNKAETKAASVNMLSWKGKRFFCILTIDKDLHTVIED